MREKGEGDIGSEQEGLWRSLSDAEKEAAIYLGVSHWQSGVNKNYLKAMGASDKIVRGLVKKGVVDERQGWKFAQEYLDQNRDRIEAVEAKLAEPFITLTDEDRAFLSEVRNRQNVAERKSKEKRCRLSSETFHKFISSFGDE